MDQLKAGGLVENGRYEAFCIEGGRKQFYRWDLDQKIVVNDPAIDEVHFCNGTSDKSLVTVVKDGRADVPNILLQTAGKVKVYGYSVNHTRVEKIYEVKDRTKPEDYVYEETEVIRWADLDKRLFPLEGKGLENILVINLREEPDEKRPEIVWIKHDYTHAEVVKALEDGKIVFLRDVDGKVFEYTHVEGNAEMFFRSIGKYQGNGIEQKMLKIRSDYLATECSYGGLTSLIKTPNPKKLIIKNANGETIAEYDGSNEITITI